MILVRRRGVSALSLNNWRTSYSLTIGDLTLDRRSRRVTRGERTIALTVREFDLLEYLMRRYDEVVSRDMLARDVWQETARATPLNNSIDVHIARLRQKVDTDGTVKLIHTVRGIGFVLREGATVIRRGPGLSSAELVSPGSPPVAMASKSR